MICTVFVVFFFCLFTVNSYKMLTPVQLRTLTSYVRSNETTPSMRQKVDTILFKRYTPIVHTLVKQFKQHHKYKCKSINHDELLMYGFIGLYHSTRKYSGKQFYHHYVQTYIKCYLYQSLTDMHPISKLPKYKRKRRKTKEQLRQILKNDQYKQIYLGTHTFVQNKVRPRYFSNDYYLKAWEVVDKMNGFDKRTMRYKYNFYFEKIRSNLEVSQLMCTSEEYVRQRVHYSKDNVVKSLFSIQNNTQNHISLNQL